MKTDPLPFNPRNAALALAVVQMLCTALAYLRGLSFGRLGGMGRWDGLWQVVPSEDLLSNPVQSLWALHANPPLYSVFGGLVMAVAGPEGLPFVMQVANLALGGATAALAFGLIWRLTRAPRWSIGVGLVVALHPALVYYQAHMLYEMWVVALVTVSVLLLHRALERRRVRDLSAWLTVLVTLAMLRSLYHLLFVVAAMAFAWPLWRALWCGEIRGCGALHGRAGVALLVAGALLLPVGWYAKNKVQHGFFGASSWMGLGWYKVVWENTTETERLTYVEAGVIEDWQARLEPYITRPMAYREHGFDAGSNVPMLNRNDFHNVNVPAIAQAYELATRRTLGWILVNRTWRVPGLYAKSYAYFMRPTLDFEQLRPLRGMLPWEVVYRWVLGGVVMVVLYWPVLAFAGVAAISLRKPRNRRDTASSVAMAWTMGYMIFICAYVFAVGTLFETGENERFRFGIEPVWIVLAGYVAWRWLAKKKTTEPAF